MGEMLCWGAGLLGLGKDLDSSAPQETGWLRGREVQGVSCGEEHWVFVLADGTVFTRGDNGKGQLEQVMALNTEQVVRVACGKHHTVALCKSGSIFAWGAATYGQIGNGECCSIVSCPRRVGEIKVPVVQVTCGRYHSLALCKDGAIYSWGQNTYGQLGLGEGFYSQLQPNRVTSLTGIPVAQIAAGGRHSFALSFSGTVFSWGKNSHGQLGLKDQKDKVSPCRVKQMKRLNVTYISCGSQHTAVLTKDGRVFTCGDGSAGQLGLSTTANVSTFQMVEQIEGEVSQIACGSYHTLAYIPSSDRVISFGFASRKLAEGSTSNHIRAESENAKVYKIFAGPNVNFIQTQLPIPSADFRCRDSAQQIFTMDETIVDKWINTADFTRERQDARNEIALVFSSASCLTGSFSRKSNGAQCKAQHDLFSVDVEAARELLQKFTSKDWIANLITSCLTFALIPSLKHLCHEEEALMVYLILPEFPATHQVEFVQEMVALCAGSIVRLDNASKKILEKCWSMLKSSYLNNLVQMFRTAVIVMITSIHALHIEAPGHPAIKVLARILKDTLDVLELVYNANMKAHHNIPQNKFYVDEVLLFDVGYDLFTFRQFQQIMPDEVKKKAVPVMFCCYPFILNLDAKIRILHVDSVLKKSEAFFEAMAFSCLNVHMGNPEPPKYPVFNLKVKRQDLVSDTFKKLKNMDEYDLKKELVVKFDGEQGIDLGAIRQEFFLSVFKELVKPDSNMFMYCYEFRNIWFPSKITEPIEKYYLLGILCGLVSYNFSVVYIPFPLALFKKLLGVEPTLEDLKGLDPNFANSLQCILDTEDFSEMYMDFSVTWDKQDVDVISNGSNRQVTNENKKKYVRACVNYIFTTSVKAPFAEFRRGFYKVCDKELLKFFQPQELMDVLIGNDDYDWKILEQNTAYEGKYSRSHPTITMFWKVFHELPLEEKKKFLSFLLGTDRIPVYGMTCVRILIVPSQLTDDNYPEANVCFGFLILPGYTSAEILKKKLVRAINTKKRFDKW
ncbi:probable E3 ubiquitin-protein ligase HERC6 isoform X2 [Scyliorhinus canicula]|uniref:probable E3 ubiquitin-protein ligase HERC6 isoform X2 n=1 Tax=Scyliorhinus canicula TaxID=7830 RepID=UPI0018F2A406|nr:probable E3 ubiquitin-protein ligase HERC6 isoform X2 [Scyliorhinus canicula]